MLSVRVGLVEALLLLLFLLSEGGLSAGAVSQHDSLTALGKGVGRGKAGKAVMDTTQLERLVVVDTDAGGDDALALLALLGAARERPPPVRVLAVTCVHGNTGVRNVTRNVLATLRTARRTDVPVYAGADAALVVTPRADDYFGSDGFGDFLPPAKQGPSPSGQLKAEHAANALVRMAARDPGRITLVCLGPLTNVALAVRLDPAFLDNLADVFVLGGSARALGNTKASTEYNVHMDAEAFQAVLTSVAKPLFVLPWETVINLGMTEEWRYGVLGALGSPQTEFLNQAERNTVGRRKGLYALGDGLLALAVVHPDVVRKRTTTRMEVVLGDGSARGVTLVDYVNKNPGPRNVVLLEDADKALVECLLMRLLAAPSAAAPTAPCASMPADSQGSA